MCGVQVDRKRDGTQRSIFYLYSAHCSLHRSLFPISLSIFYCRKRDGTQSTLLSEYIDRKWDTEIYVESNVRSTGKRYKERWDTEIYGESNVRSTGKR